MRSKQKLFPLSAVLLAAAAATGAMAQPAAASQALRPELVARGLEHPWGMTFIDGGRVLVTERPGRLRMIDADGRVGPPIKGLPEIDAGGQGGLHDVLADSSFKTSRIIYFCFAEPEAGNNAGGNSTALASARLSADATQLERVTVLFSQKPKFRSSAHFGCRIVEGRDGKLWLTLGDRYSRMKDAQTFDNHHGKIVRIAKDGSAPRDNPFVDGKNKALPEIWSYGHRNAQGAALDLQGRLWMHEHGPQGGDEINRIEPGKNYGWPVITYGENYGGGKIGEGETRREGMEQPAWQWTPSIAPSGMAFLRSERYGKAWSGNLFVGSLKFRYLARLEVKDDKVLREERLLTELKQRIRDVREGPDGLLYLLTDEDDGRLIRLLPAR